MKILVLPLPEMSHINSFLHLIKKLGTFEHDCTIYVPKEYDPIVKNYNYTVRHYNQYFLENIYKINENIKQNKMEIDADKDSLTKDNIQSSCNKYMASYVFRLRCMKKYLRMEEDFASFDLIIHDYYLDFGHFLAWIYKIPSVTLISTLLPVKKNREHYLENFINMKYFSNIYDDILQQEELRNILTSSLDRMSERIILHTNQPFDFFRNGISKLNIFSTSKEIYPFEFDDWEIEFIGRTLIEDDCIHKVKDMRKRILFYFGAIETQEQVQLFRCVLRNLNLLSYEVHVVIKYQEDESYIEKDIKEHIILEQNVRLEDKFSEMDLYICHGGLGGIQEAIVKGVPIVGIGTSGERYENSKRMEQLGIGKSIAPRCECISSMLMRSVEEILSCDNYQKRCKEYGKTLRVSEEHLDCIVRRILNMAKK